MKISKELKQKLFILLNKKLFCELLKFHLPVANNNGYECLICKRGVDKD